MITIYCLCFQEELMIQHFINHYRAMFPGCRIIFYDNYSIDKTTWIAWNNDCEVNLYDTAGKLSDQTYLEIKNNCWKDAKTDWVAIVDTDEHCVIDAEMLKREEEIGNTIIKFAGINMVNHEDSLDISKITRGFRAPSYDKFYIFNKSKVNEINYGMGCHSASPEGEIKLSTIEYTCRHYKYINVEYMIKRHKMFASRMSDDNLKRGLGGHYLYSEETIRKEFQDAIKRTT